MSERGIFSYRYMIPGFIFVLTIFTINIEIVAYSISIPQELQLSAIISIATFLSSPALGFIISQRWYSEFRKKYEHLHTKWHNELHNRKIIEDNTVANCDYWLYAESKIKKRIFTYLERRLDFFHTLASTYYVVIPSLFAGYGIKLIIYFILYASGKIDDFKNFYVIDCKLFLALLVIYNIVVLIILFYTRSLCWTAANEVKEEQDNMLVRIIQKWDEKRKSVPT